MKKLIAVVLSALLVALPVVACSNKNNDDFKVTPINQTSPAEGGSFALEVEGASAYTIISNNSFLTSEGTTVTVAPNTGLARSGTITVTSDGKTATVTVTQEGVPTLAVTTMPQTAYTEGDALDLSDLALTHTDKDGKTTQLSHDSAGVSASITHGTALAATDTVVTMTYDGLEASFAIIVSPKPADPDPAPDPTPDPNEPDTPPAVAPLFTDGPSVTAGTTTADFAAAFNEYCTYNVIVCPEGTQTPNGYNFKGYTVAGQARQGSVRSARTLTVSGLSPGTTYVAFIYGAHSTTGACTKLERLEFTTLADSGGTVVYYSDDDSPSTPAALPQNIVFEDYGFDPMSGINTIAPSGVADKACTVYALAVFNTGAAPATPTAAQMKAGGNSMVTDADGRFDTAIVITHDTDSNALDAGSTYHIYLYAENANGCSVVERVSEPIAPNAA